MTDKMRGGFVKDALNRLVVVAAGASLLERKRGGLAVDEKGRLIVVGPEGEEISGGGLSKAEVETLIEARVAKLDTASFTNDNEHVPSSALVKSSVPSFAVLPASTAGVKNSTTLVAIDEANFKIPIGSSATERYWVDGMLLVEGTGAEGDLKLAFNVPAASTGFWGAIANGTSLPGFAAVGVSQTPGAIRTALTENLTYGTINGKIGILFQAFIQGGGTAGNVVPTYAQATAKEETLKILANSVMRIHKVSA